MKATILFLLIVFAISCGRGNNKQRNSSLKTKSEEISLIKDNSDTMPHSQVFKDSIIDINVNFAILFSKYDNLLKLWYEPRIINKYENDTLEISGFSYENGSELDVRISPNKKYIVMDNIIKNHVETDRGKELYENYTCVIVNVERAIVERTMQSNCGGEWDSDNNWIDGDKIIFHSK